MITKTKIRHKNYRVKISNLQNLLESRQAQWFIVKRNCHIDERHIRGSSSVMEDGYGRRKSAKRSGSETMVTYSGSKFQHIGPAFNFFFGQKPT